MDRGRRVAVRRVRSTDGRGRPSVAGRAADTDVGRAPARLLGPAVLPAVVPGARTRARGPATTAAVAAGRGTTRVRRPGRGTTVAVRRPGPVVAGRGTTSGAPRRRAVVARRGHETARTLRRGTATTGVRRRLGRAAAPGRGTGMTGVARRPRLAGVPGRGTRAIGVARRLGLVGAAGRGTTVARVPSGRVKGGGPRRARAGSASGCRATPTPGRAPGTSGARRATMRAWTGPPRAMTPAVHGTVPGVTGARAVTRAAATGGPAGMTPLPGRAARRRAVGTIGGPADMTAIHGRAV